MATKLNDLVAGTKATTGGDWSTYAGFSHYITRVNPAYKAAGAGTPVRAAAIIDALATEGGLKWLSRLGFGNNIHAKLRAAYTSSVAAANGAVIVDALCSALKTGIL